MFLKNFLKVFLVVHVLQFKAQTESETHIALDIKIPLYTFFLYYWKIYFLKPILYFKPFCSLHHGWFVLVPKIWTVVWSSIYQDLWLQWKTNIEKKCSYYKLTYLRYCSNCLYRLRKYDVSIFQWLHLLNANNIVEDINNIISYGLQKLLSFTWFSIHLRTMYFTQIYRLDLMVIV